MKRSTLVWLAVSAGLVMAMRATDLPGWAAVAVVAGALLLAIPVSVRRFRQERDLLRTTWRALTTR